MKKFEILTAIDLLYVKGGVVYKHLGNCTPECGCGNEPSRPIPPD